MAKPVKTRGKKFDVKGGIAEISVPGFDGAEVTQIPKKQLEHHVQRAARQLEQATKTLAEAQEAFDEATETHTDLAALVADVTGDPA